MRVLRTSVLYTMLVASVVLAEDEEHMEDWSETCSFADQSSCNEWQLGFLDFERHHSLKQTKRELAAWNRELKENKFNDEHHRTRVVWSARVTEEIQNSIEEKGEQPKRQKYKKKEH